MNNSIALLGQPNSGKSTVFNALTGSRQHVGNWPGKTVEKRDGFYQYKGTRYTVTDLPGSYGLSGNSDEEVITADFIKADLADLVCILVDASQLERSMYMVAEFAAMDKPAVLLLNMMDVAKAQNKEIDHELLEKRLGIPVLPFTAAESKGYEELKALLAAELEHPHKLTSGPSLPEERASSADKVQAESEAKYRWIGSILESVTRSEQSRYALSKRDKRLLSPILGKFACFGTIVVGFLRGYVRLCLRRQSGIRLSGRDRLSCQGGLSVRQPAFRPRPSGKSNLPHPDGLWLHDRGYLRHKSYG